MGRKIRVQGLLIQPDPQQGKIEEGQEPGGQVLPGEAPQPGKPIQTGPHALVHPVRRRGQAAWLSHKST